MARKYKRYLSHNAGTGKDTMPRDLAVSEQEFARNWCATFGHKRVDIVRQTCLDCGFPLEHIEQK